MISEMTASWGGHFQYHIIWLGNRFRWYWKWLPNAMVISNIIVGAVLECFAKILPVTHENRPTPHPRRKSCYGLGCFTRHNMHNKPINSHLNVQLASKPPLSAHAAPIWNWWTKTNVFDTLWKRPLTPSVSHIHVAEFGCQQPSVYSIYSQGLPSVDLLAFLEINHIPPFEGRSNSSM